MSTASGPTQPSQDDDTSYDFSVSEDEDPHQHIDAGQIRRALRAVLQRHGCRRARLSVALVDDRRIADLNQAYLQHTGPTDVLSFDLRDAEQEAPLEGEIVVSTETAAREAARREHPVEAEVLLYVVHGALHLLGHDDQTEEQAARMHVEENRVLTALGLGAVYGETPD